MSKKVITKIAMDEINELLSKVELIPQEAREILYKGAYIRLFDSNIFKGEEGKKEILGATADGKSIIYKDAQGTVNSNLIEQLPQYYIRELTL